MHARQYILACESEEDQRTWMNLLSMASIAFGSGQASMQRVSDKPHTIADDTAAELASMARVSEERRGGVRASRVDGMHAMASFLVAGGS